VKKLLHDVLNDLAVAMGLVQAFLDEKIEPDRSRFNEILRVLEHADASIAELRLETRAAGLPRTESMLDAIVEGSPYAKLLVDESGRITLVNAETEKLFGYPREELLGRSVELLVPERFKTEHPALRHFYNERPEVRPMGAGRDLYGRHKDGGEFPIEIGLNPIETDAGAFVLAAISDITERKRSEELRLVHAGMQQHASELEALNRDLASASRFKTEFIATMSHELRTPLSAIIGATELLAKATLPDREAVSVATINESAEALFALIGSILDFSKIEAGKMDLTVKPFEIEAVVESTVEVVAQLVRAKDVALHAYVDPSIPCVKGDANHVRQILLNLLGNSAKFTDRGHIVVRAMPLEAAGGRIPVRFEVQDTGIGIAPEFLPSLFEPFAQSGPAAAKKFGGSGLGLSISKRLVELMGGEIGVASELGAGSLFWFTVAFEPAGDPVPRGRTIEGTAGLVLSADDVFAQIVATYMTSWSMESKRATSAAEVLRAIKSSDATRWVAIVDLDSIGAADTDVTLAILQAIAPGRIIPIGRERPLTKLVHQSALFSAITKAATLETHEPNAGVEIAEISTSNASRPAGLVLVAEDDARLQRLLKLQFAELGFPVAFVSDGLAAVEAVRDFDFAMVLMDCQMPELDGLAATMAIREAERQTGKHVPIVAMTANAFSEDRAACIAAGMDDYLAKPVRLAGLRTIVETWSRTSRE
jgi:PAS domain S-box-containing protein